jgi:hypothetical protein
MNIPKERPIVPLPQKIGQVPTADYLALTKEFGSDDEIQQFIDLYHRNQILASNIGENDTFAFFLLKSKGVDGKSVWFKISQKKLAIAQEFLKCDNKDEQSSGKYRALFGRIAQRIIETVKQNLLGDPHN